MTVLYLDTEFNGHGGDLISMALVGVDGESFYHARFFELPVDPWVCENVIPKIDTPSLRPAVFKRAFHQWIQGFDNPEIICDWHADAAYFSAMLSGPDYSTSLDFPYRMTVLKTPPGQPVSKNPHNVLADATALMEWHRKAFPDA